MYVYAADTWCDSCGERIRQDLIAAGEGPEDPDDPYIDSDEWPQPAMGEETDGPDHCAAAGDCLEPLDLREWGLPADAPMYGAETPTIGALLSEGLTEYGVSYLCELLDDDDPTPYQSALYRFWREVFADELSTVEV